MILGLLGFLLADSLERLTLSGNVMEAVESFDWESLVTETPRLPEHWWRMVEGCADSWWGVLYLPLLVLGTPLFLWGRWLTQELLMAHLMIAPAVTCVLGGDYVPHYAFPVWVLWAVGVAAARWFLPRDRLAGILMENPRRAPSQIDDLPPPG
jgi:hypothetical protein